MKKTQQISDNPTELSPAQLATVIGGHKGWGSGGGGGGRGGGGRGGRWGGGRSRN